MRLRVSLLAWLAAAAIPLNAAHALEIPQNDGFLTDAAGILSQESERNLEERLRAYSAETSNEIAVVIVSSLSGSDIADSAVEIGRKWQVGTEKNNGILLLISYEDRQAFIATGYGLEGAVPDIVAAGIIERDLAPEFRKGSFAEGIQAAIEALQKHIGGEYTSDRYTSGNSDAFAFLLFFVALVLQVAAPILGRSKSWWQGGLLGGVVGLVLALVYSWWLSIPLLVVMGLLFDFVISRMKPKRRRPWSSGGFGGGFGSGGSSGGGFGGFSGGSFGGGGGGGRW